MFSIDYTVRVTDLAVGVGGIVAFLRMFVQTRDVLRELTRTINELRADVERIDGRQLEHERWLIRARLDSSASGDRR